MSTNIHEFNDHGHVIPRVDGVRAECGGPVSCDSCLSDFNHMHSVSSDVWRIMPDVRFSQDGRYQQLWQNTANLNKTEWRDVPLEQ